MTQWTTHIPKRDGDAPEGVTLETHREVCKITGKPYVEQTVEPTPATYAQVVAWCEANGCDVPAPPIDYEAWGPVMEQYGWRGAFYSQNDIDRLIAAFKLAMTIPECREVIEG